MVTFVESELQLLLFLLWLFAFQGNVKVGGAAAIEKGRYAILLQFVHLQFYVGLSGLFAYIPR